MRELDSRYIERSGALSFRCFHDYFSRDKKESCLIINELLDQPWAGYSIDLGPFARNPLHFGPQCNVIAVDEPIFDKRLLIL